MILTPPTAAVPRINGRKCEKIALTQPMGWNSWNCWGGAVSQDKVLSSARAMVEKGLRDHGWTYVNIDDGWQGVRGGEFNAIQPNSKLPDMKALDEQIHQLGLKFGIYSAPWRATYEGHIGSSSDHEDGSYDWVKAGDHNRVLPLWERREDATQRKARQLGLRKSFLYRKGRCAMGGMGSRLP